MPSLLGDLFEGAGSGEAPARVGHQDVYRAELSFDLTAHGFDLGESGDIGRHLHRPAARPLDLAPHRG